MSNPGQQNAGISVDEQVEKVFAWRRGFNAVFLIDIGVDLGLFKTLAEKPGQTAPQIAASLKLHPPYVETWCMTAVGLGLLDADEQRHFRLAPHMDKILASPGHPRDLTGYIRLGTAFLIEDFEHCRKAFRTGDTVPFQGRSHAFADTIGDAIGGLHAATARKILPDLTGMKERLENGARVLEIGCGTGRSLVQMGRQLGGSGVILGIDLSRGMLRVARRRLEQRGLAGQISLQEADGLNLPLAPARFDRLLMTFTLELFDTPEIPRVLAECARVLRREGRLCVLSLSREGGPNTLTRLYEWVHELIPQYADCRPIYAQQALQSAGFRILRAGTISLGGLQAEEVLAQPPA